MHVAYRSSFTAVLAAVSISVLCPVPANATGSAEEAELAKNAMAATALLARETEDGGTNTACTATAFERKDDVYLFLTAAHCVADDDTAHERVELDKTSWFITFDDSDKKVFYPAKVVAAGYQREGDDFAVIEVQLDRVVPVIAMAKKNPTVGEPVINVAAALGLGKQFFRGHVTMDRLRRPVVARSINWRDAVLLQINVGGGSSGSAVISTEQKAIVAILVGSISAGDTPNVVAIPVSKLEAFLAATRAGTYKWFKTDAAKSDASAAKPK